MMSKNESYGYGNQAKMSSNSAPEMKKTGMVKKNIPDAMTNKTGKDMKFEGGKMNGICYTHDRKSCQ